LSHHTFRIRRNDG